MDVVSQVKLFLLFAVWLVVQEGRKITNESLVQDEGTDAPKYMIAFTF